MPHTCKKKKIHREKQIFYIQLNDAISFYIIFKLENFLNELVIQIRDLQSDENF